MTSQGLLTCEDVRVEFGALRAVDGVSLSVREGAVVGLLGPNGAGKTTLFNAVAGHHSVTGGRMFFEGQDVTRYPAWRRARLGIARTFQLGSLINELNVTENVMLGFDQAVRRVGDKTTRSRSLRARSRLAETRKLLRKFDLEHLAAHEPLGLPAGTRRRIEVARAVASSARLILLDEPAVGLTEGERAELGTLLRELARDGSSVLITDHTTDMVLGTCDWVYVLNFGRVLAKGTPSDIRNDVTVIETYLGQAVDHE